MRRASLILTLAAALGAAASGCASIELRHGQASTRETWRYTSHTILFGFQSITRAEDLSRVCPGGWSSVRTYKNAWQSAATLVTLSFYSPSTVELGCVAAVTRAGS